MIPDICQEVCRCRECGRWLITTDPATREFFVCPMGHGRLIPNVTLADRVLSAMSRIPDDVWRPHPQAVVRHLAAGQPVVLKHL